MTPRTPARDEQVLASSYGPVYAVLSDEGRSLWVSDGVNYKGHAVRPGARRHRDAALGHRRRQARERAADPAIRSAR